MAQIHGRLVVAKKDEVYLTISTEDSIRKELSEFFKFKVPGASFIPAVRKKFWDDTFVYFIFKQINYI